MRLIINRSKAFPQARLEGWVGLIGNSQATLTQNIGPFNRESRSLGRSNSTRWFLIRSRGPQESAHWDVGWLKDGLTVPQPFQHSSLYKIQRREREGKILTSHQLPTSFQDWRALEANEGEVCWLARFTSARLRAWGHSTSTSTSALAISYNLLTQRTGLTGYLS